MRKSYHTRISVLKNSLRCLCSNNFRYISKSNWSNTFWCWAIVTISSFTKYYLDFYLFPQIIYAQKGSSHYIPNILLLFRNKTGMLLTEFSFYLFIYLFLSNKDCCLVCIADGCGGITLMAKCHHTTLSLPLFNRKGEENVMKRAHGLR